MYFPIKEILKIIFVMNISLFLTKAYTQNPNNEDVTLIKTYPQVAIAGSEVREFQSAITGETYFIYVSLPRSYNASVQSYPVLYIMDADGAFGTYTEISRLLSLNEEIPEIIIVGIAYKVPLDEYLYNRRRDYTPTALEKYPGSGGGEKFSSFINKELIPVIDTEYRVKKSERAISGFSYGGLFVLYALFHEHQLFNRYHAGSTYFRWDNYVTFEYEKKYFEKSSNLPIRLLLTVGSLENQESYIKPHEQFTQILNSREYSGLELRFIILEGETHYSSCGNAITKALIWLFQNQGL